MKKKNEIGNYVHVYLGKLKVYVSTFFIFYLGKGKKDAEFRFSVGQKIMLKIGILWLLVPNFQISQISTKYNKLTI